MKARFQKDTGCYKCFVCGKLTRDTGRDEGAFDMCARCLLESYAENAASDNGKDSPEHKAALKALHDFDKRKAA